MPDAASKSKGIKSWNEADRPREKMQHHGASVLSDTELLAILIATGSKNKTAIDLARELLMHYNNDLTQLAKAPLKALSKAVKGIGSAKAIGIAAALELGRRRRDEDLPSILNSAEVIYKTFLHKFLDQTVEHFGVALLAQNLKLIHFEMITKGGLTGTVADPRVILKLCLTYDAVALVLMHNHPSGNLKPSDQDIAITKKIKNACMYFDLQLIDHVIFTNNGYSSLANEGLI